MQFKVIGRRDRLQQYESGVGYLRKDSWNDYSFVTLFSLSVGDESGAERMLGGVRIGFKGQTTETATHVKLGQTFYLLGEDYFSVGIDVDYYQNVSGLSVDRKHDIFSSLRDIAFDLNIIKGIENEEVFNVSLLRGVSVSTIRGQFHRVINGGVPLTDFNFKFVSYEDHKIGTISLSFDVHAESNPSTNVHALIGRNGVGKSTILNYMVHAVAGSQDVSYGIFHNHWVGADVPIPRDYFGGVVSVSFSAFDTLVHPCNKIRASESGQFHYLGMRADTSTTGGALKSSGDLFNEFDEALKICLSQEARKRRWFRAIEALQLDSNFSEEGLLRMMDIDQESVIKEASLKIRRMSSGHAMVLHVVTSLVAVVEEKTLVLFDEPESHLHPPLLSAFIRALSELLNDRNGVAIIATHSPVVLQEIPKSSVWKIYRSADQINVSRPDDETFGENVGTLTREVFGLEVIKSGFHSLLEKSVASGKSYEIILAEYGGQLGAEAKGILKAMVLDRDRDY